MGFTKLDEGILKSSIMGESSDTFKVWIALLASCGYDGIARVSPIFLSSVCHLSIEIVENSLAILESPDRYSRSTTEDGRRIKKADGGYFIINYSKYRGHSYSQKPEAIRQRRKRERDINVTKRNASVTSRDVSASASSSYNNKIKYKMKDIYTAEFESFWSIYPRKKEKADAFATWKQLNKEQKKEVAIASVNYAEECRLNQTEEQYIKHAKSFLNKKKERWKDYLKSLSEKREEERKASIERVHKKLLEKERQ